MANKPKKQKEYVPRKKPVKLDLTKKEYKTSGLPILEVSYLAVLTRPLYYPANQFTSSLLYLMNRIAFTKTEIEHLREMGFTVNISLREIEIPLSLK